MSYNTLSSMQGQNSSYNPNLNSGLNDSSNGAVNAAVTNNSTPNPLPQFNQNFGNTIPNNFQNQSVAPQYNPNLNFNQFPAYQAPVYNQVQAPVNPQIQNVVSPQPGFHPSNLQQLKQEPKPTPIISNKTENSKNINPFLRLSIIIFIILLLLSVIVVVISLAAPNSVPGKWLSTNTFLKNLNTKSSTQASASTGVSNSKSPSSIGNIDDFSFQPATGSKPVVQVIEDSLPSVLSISLKSKGDNINLSQDLSAGTGYIVSTDGLVVTNKHVVAAICKNDPDRIQITGLSHDQKAYNLILKSIDPIDDLAILKIDSTNEKFPTISFGNSDNLKLGQDVVAIGNVLGELQNTVTKGIVSGLNRSFETEITDQCTGLNFQADNLIQTDAAINRGNSGGPLFNSSGQLIGMNTLGTVDAQNIGLAIPSATIRNVLDGYSSNNLIVRARLGVSSLQINSIRKAQNAWIPTDYGELVFRQQGSPVDSNSAASEAGIKEGDIILEFNSKKLITTNTNPSPIRREVLNSQAGQKVELLILKASSKNQNGFTYEKDPVKVSVILGSTSFDLKTKQVVAN